MCHVNTQVSQTGHPVNKFNVSAGTICLPGRMIFRTTVQISGHLSYLTFHRIGYKIHVSLPQCPIISFAARGNTPMSDIETVDPKPAPEFELADSNGHMPAQLIVDRNGMIRHKHYGNAMSDIPENGDILAKIDQLNGEGA